MTITNWQYRQAGHEKWNLSRPGPATQIHADLLHNQSIPDPFLDLNEKEVQWVGETDWEYRGELYVDENLQQFRRHLLVFEGLDTFATVYFNGAVILKSGNMYTEEKVDVGSLIRSGSNEVVICFDSALRVARELEKKNGKFVCWNGETCRLHIRKAPYHFGWDWGPVIMTCGPYKPVHLEAFEAAIDDFYVGVEVSDNLDVDLQLEVAVTSQGEVDATFEIFSPSGEVLVTKKLSKLTSGAHSTTAKLAKPNLWYPHTLGTPALHRFRVTLVGKSTTLDTVEKHIGLRKIDLVQERLEKGTSFYFKVNNVAVYCAGANWIPAHSLLTLLTHQDYTQWLELAARGNQTMIRVWGGGYYEDDFFYSECDRLGLLVWQDFMFACGQYPGDDDFIASVTREATHQLKRLRNFACLALFAGNNEDYQIAETYKLEWDPSDYSGNYKNTNFPARVIYEKTLPNLMAKYLPSVPYHPGSPWSGEHPTTDQTVGDLHQWNVWHGTQEKYQDWYKLGGRFVSEFGMEALPSLKTYKQCITDPTQLYPQSEYVDHHNKADGFERRLALYVIENIKVSSLSMSSWIYATQLMQAECLAYAYKCWRRKWKDENRRETGGALVWQLNDCWPVASWSIVDFYRRPKLAYYAIKRESQAVALGLYRIKNGGKQSSEIGAPHDYSKAVYSLDIWGANSSLKEVEATLTVDLYDATSGAKLACILTEEIVLRANGSTEFASELSIPDGHVIAHAYLTDSEGNSVASGSDWPQPLKYLHLPDRQVHYSVGEDKITLTAGKPVKGVELLFENDLFPDDNGFDLFPGETKVVRVSGLRDSENVEVRYYQSEET